MTNEAAHRAACALCRNRTPEQVSQLRREVARDLAGHDGIPPVPTLTAAEVIAAITQQRGEDADG